MGWHGCIPCSRCGRCSICGNCHCYRETVKLIDLSGSTCCDEARKAERAACIAEIREMASFTLLDAAEAHANYDPMFGRVTGDHYVRPDAIDGERMKAALAVIADALEKQLEVRNKEKIDK